MPGKTLIHHCSRTYSTPSETMRPHSGVGGLAPRPRKERPATSRITVPMSSVICTITGPKALGRMWRRTIRESRTPIVLAAST